MRTRILDALGFTFTVVAWLLTLAFFAAIIIVTYIVR